MGSLRVSPPTNEFLKNATVTFDISTVVTDGCLHWEVVEVLRGLFRDGCEIHLVSEGDPESEEEVVGNLRKSGVPFHALNFTDADSKISTLVAIGSTFHFDKAVDDVARFFTAGIPCMLVDPESNHIFKAPDLSPLLGEGILNSFLVPGDPSMHGHDPLVSDILSNEDDWEEVEELTDMVYARAELLSKAAEASPDLTLVTDRRTIPTAGSDRVALVKLVSEVDILKPFAAVLEDVDHLLDIVAAIIYRHEADGACNICKKTFESEHVETCWVGQYKNLVELMS